MKEKDPASIKRLLSAEQLAQFSILELNDR